MTRKQALNKAIQALSKKKEYSEVIQLLQDIHDELPLIHWSDKSIRDTVEQFIVDNGRRPSATDFCNNFSYRRMNFIRLYFFAFETNDY